MTKRDSKASSRLLTEVELELMNIIWKLGEATVADVLGKLPPNRKLAYTSVSTILRILEGKGVLEARKAGRGHRYCPRIVKEDYEAASLRHLVDNVFDGTPSSLVRCLLEQSELSGEELASIRNLLQEKPAK